MTVFNHSEFHSFLHSISELIKNPTTLRVVALAITTTCIFFAVRTATRDMRWIRTTEDEYFFDIRVAYLGNISRPETVKGKLKEIDDAKRAHIFDAWWRFARLITLGIVFPMVVFGIFVAEFNWLFANQHPLLDIRTQRAIDTPSLTQTASFVLSQTIQGALADLIEVFHLEFATVRYNPADLPFLALIWLYRVIIGLFTGVIGVFLYRIVRLRNRKGAAQEVLEEKLRSAEAQVIDLRQSI